MGLIQNKLIDKAFTLDFKSYFGLMTAVNKECYHLWMIDLQKWLREKHQIFIDIGTDATVAPRYCIDIFIFKGNPKCLSCEEWDWEKVNIKPEEWGFYYNYEKCLEKALEIALNLIKE